MPNEVNTKIFKGVAWKWLERLGVQGVKFIIQIFLARLLLPDDYGVVSLLAVFISVADILVQGGLGSALVQKKDADKHDISTILLTGLALSVAIYIILFLLAPSIALFYKTPILSPTLRVLSLVIFIVSINAVQVAKLSRELSFRLIFIGNTLSNILSGVIAIAAAYLGAGVWALVMQQLLSYLFYTIFLGVKDRIGFGRFSRERLKLLFSFGWKIMLANTVATLTENLYNIVIGRIYGTKMTGYYSRGQQFPLAMCSSINHTISGVMYPAMASVQDDIARVKAITRKTISASTFIVFPLVVGLAVVAKPMVTLLLTEKWLPCVPFLQLECAFYATLPMMYASGQAVKATGHSQVSLILESVKSGLTLVLMLSLYRFVSIYIIVGMRAFISLVILVVQSAYARKYIGYRILERIIDIAPNLLNACIMGVIVYFAGQIYMPMPGNLVLQVCTGVVVYVGLALLTRNQNITMAKELLCKKKTEG